MKRILLFLILLLPFTRPSLEGGLNQLLTFDDLGLGGGTSTSGTYNSNDTFGFDVLLTFDIGNGNDVYGLSFWLETSTAFAGSLSITGVTYGTTYPDPKAISPNPAFFNSGSGASPGYLSEDRDWDRTSTILVTFPDPARISSLISLSRSRGRCRGHTIWHQPSPLRRLRDLIILFSLQKPICPRNITRSQSCPNRPQLVSWV